MFEVKFGPIQPHIAKRLFWIAVSQQEHRLAKRICQKVNYGETSFEQIKDIMSNLKGGVLSQSSSKSLTRYGQKICLYNYYCYSNSDFYH